MDLSSIASTLSEYWSRIQSWWSSLDTKTKIVIAVLGFIILLLLMGGGGGRRRR